MPTGNIAIIDQFLATFIGYIDSGFGLLAGDVAYLTSFLIAIDITLAGIFWAMSENTNILGQLLKKVLYVGFFAFVIGNFAILSTIIFDSFAGLGLKAGGSTMTAQDLMRPGFVANTGFVASRPLLDEIGDLLGLRSFFSNFVTIIVLLIAWAIIILSFFVLSIQLFITILEFKLTTLAGFILVPFALWNKTTFLAERVLGSVMTSGIKLMVLAVIVGIGSTAFGVMTRTFDAGNVSLEEALSAVLAAGAIFGLGIFGPGIAAGLISGAPQLGAGAVVGTVGGLAAGGYAAAAGTRAIAGGAASKSFSAIKAASAMTSGAGTAYSMARLGSGKTGLAGAAAGVAGVARAGADTAKQKLNSVISPATDAASASPPAWAQKMRRSQAMGHAGTAAAHTLRDGDHAGHSDTPKLSGNEDQ
ncbi:MAG: P-type conjugative transfer protein TrbL [Hyphomonadaceae bacterium]